MRSNGAHCNPELVKRIGETLGEADWRGTRRRGLARHLTKRIGETLGEEDWQGEGGEGEADGSDKI